MVHEVSELPILLSREDKEDKGTNWRLLNSAGCCAGKETTIDLVGRTAYRERPRIVDE
jgi:hypothetical protein